ncbi:unnamed protein product [Microthlaspi erraticum]|uniref:Uncharacterized protein n=1 Tax=Microthlaspi erraticum TaxID=1685480 RepID=A0A6D2L4M7_9BRAS|nr:unnamed protein product [Microthlaspi erraticum]
MVKEICVLGSIPPCVIDMTVLLKKFAGEEKEKEMMCVATSEPERTGASDDQYLSHLRQYPIPSIHRHRDGSAAVKLSFHEHQVKDHCEDYDIHVRRCVHPLRP